MANDIAVADDGTVYVTDTAGGYVSRWDPHGEQARLTGRDQFPGANGIALSGSTLFVGGQALWQVEKIAVQVRLSRSLLPKPTAAVLTASLPSALSLKVASESKNHRSER